MKHTMTHTGTMRYEEGKVTIGGEFWNNIKDDVVSDLLKDSKLLEYINKRDLAYKVRME